MNKGFLAAGALFMAMLCGCTVTYNANPVSIADLDPREICVIEDTRVNASFLPAFRRALERKGFSVRVLPSNSPVSTCPLTSTYVATWSWDFVPYMAYSNIVVYRDGNRVGEAVYDAPRAGWAMTTEIYEATDTKVSTMVDRLFLQSRL